MQRLPVPLVPRWFRLTGVLAVVSAIVYFSLFAGLPSPPGEGPSGLIAALWDKKLHFAAYAGLGYSLAYASVEERERGRRRTAAVVLAAVAFGVGIELFQGLLPTRYFGAYDLLANALGALLVLPWFGLESRFDFVRLPGR